MKTADIEVTGRVWGGQEFRIHETWEVIEGERILDVFAGRLAAYVVRRYLPEEICRTISARFWDSGSLDARQGDDYGGVEAYLLGASHIEKDTSTYLDDVQRTAPALARVYADVGEPMSRFRHVLQQVHGDSLLLRPARDAGRDAASSKLVYWNSDEEYLLKPHDDWAQTRAREQQGFEIQSVERVVAVNVYAEVPSDSGQLELWNVEPDDAARARLGLEEVGYPYPTQALMGFRSMIVPVQRGDLCVLNGNLIHAVRKGQPRPEAPRRVLSTCFLAQLNRTEIVYWT